MNTSPRLCRVKEIRPYAVVISKQTMETFLPDTVKAILLGLLAVAFALARLARALPHVAWLQVFRLPVMQMSEEQRARRRRSGNRLAGLEIVLAGLALPLLY